MGVICASDDRVKGAGHQRDKYKLKLMQVSFLPDQFVLGGCRELGMVHLPFGLPFQFRAWRQKNENKVHLPKDVLQHHRHESKTQMAETIFIQSYIKFVTPDFASKLCSKIRRVWKINHKKCRVRFKSVIKLSFEHLKWNAVQFVKQCKSDSFILIFGCFCLLSVHMCQSVYLHLCVVHPAGPPELLSQLPWLPVQELFITFSVYLRERETMLRAQAHNLSIQSAV